MTCLVYKRRSKFTIATASELRHIGGSRFGERRRRWPFHIDRGVTETFVAHRLVRGAFALAVDRIRLVRRVDGSPQRLLQFTSWSWQHPAIAGQFHLATYRFHGFHNSADTPQFTTEPTFSLS